MPLVKMLRFEVPMSSPQIMRMFGVFAAAIVASSLVTALGDLLGYGRGTMVSCQSIETPAIGHWSNRPRRGSESSQNTGLSALGDGASHLSRTNAWPASGGTQNYRRRQWRGLNP